MSWWARWKANTPTKRTRRRRPAVRRTTSVCSTALWKASRFKSQNGWWCQLDEWKFLWRIFDFSFKNGTRSSLTFSNQRVREIERDNQILLSKIMKSGPNAGDGLHEVGNSARKVCLTFIVLFNVSVLNFASKLFEVFQSFLEVFFDWSCLIVWSNFPSRLKDLSSNPHPKSTAKSNKARSTTRIVSLSRSSTKSPLAARKSTRQQSYKISSIVLLAITNLFRKCFTNFPSVDVIKIYEWKTDRWAFLSLLPALFQRSFPQLIVPGWKLSAQPRTSRKISVHSHVESMKFVLIRTVSNGKRGCFPECWLEKFFFSFSFSFEQHTKVKEKVCSKRQDRNTTQDVIEKLTKSTSRVISKRHQQKKD